MLRAALFFIVPSLLHAACFTKDDRAPKEAPQEICLESVTEIENNRVRIVGKRNGETFSEISRASMPREMYAPGVFLREATLSYKRYGSANCFDNIIEILIYWKTLKGQKTKILLQPLLRETKALSPCGGDFETSEYPYRKS